MRKITAEEGFLALYTGFAASMLGLSHVVVYFCCYERMKLYFSRLQQASGARPEDPLSSRYIFLCACASKVLTSLVTYPHEVIRARQQDTRKGDLRDSGVVGTIRNTYRLLGPAGFYNGFRLNLIRIVPQNAVVFVLYEYLINLLNPNKGSYTFYFKL